VSHVFESDELIGTVLGRYRIDARIARGGMGVLYRAEHTGLGRVAALKVIAPEFSKDEGFRARFEREARTAAAIDHPNVVPVWDYDEDRGRLYIAMRFVAGRDLGVLLRAEGRMAPARIAAIVAQAAAGLDAAHRAGLVHRDVKPGNLLIERRGNSEHTWVTDFGLARAAARSGTGLTKAGTVLGTLDFCPPEQLEDKPLDGRTDVYALGCVLYAALAGKVPFPRDTDAARMIAHMSMAPPALPDPVQQAQFGAVIERALAKEPGARFPTAEAFGQAVLAAHHSQRAPVARAPQPVPRQPPATPPPATPAPPPRTPAPAPGTGSHGPRTPAPTHHSTPTPRPPVSQPGHPRTPPPYTPPPHTPAPPPAAAKPPPGRRRLVLGAVAAVVVLALAGIAFALGGGDDNGGAGDRAATSTPGARSTPGEVAASVTQEEAAGVLDAFGDAFESGDYTEMANQMTADAQIVWPGVWDASGAMNVRDSFESQLSRYSQPAMDRQPERFIEAGDDHAATLMARITVRDGGQVQAEGEVTLEIVREDGDVKISRLDGQ
jgi:serine/threonine protein kinase/ketosteroid isomerase-like protein